MSGLFSHAAGLNPADGYALAYGSHATAPGPASDLDLLYTGTQPLPSHALDRLITAVKHLHTSHGLHLDEEVGYDIKLYATTAEIEQAAALHGFDDTTDYATPIGDPAALNSPPFKLRLILNALSTPHVFLAGDIHLYRRHTALAERGCALLALRVTGRQETCISDAVAALVSSPRGLSGKHFLGYGPGSHLHSTVRRGLAHLHQEGLIHIDGDTITWRQQ